MPPEENSTDNGPARIAPKPAQANKKQKAVAFANWRIPSEKDTPEKRDSILRSSKGFALFANEHTTLEEQALIDLAKENGGSARVMVEMNIVVAQEKPTSLDTSKIKLVA